MCGLLPTDRRSLFSVISLAFSFSPLAAALALGPMVVVHGDQFTSEQRSTGESVEVTIGQVVVVSGPKTRQWDQTGKKGTPKQTIGSEQDVALDAVVDNAVSVSPAETSSQATLRLNEDANKEMSTEANPVATISQVDQQTESVSGVMEVAEAAASQGVSGESLGDPSVIGENASTGPSDELQKVIEVLHSSVKSVEQLIDDSTGSDTSDSLGSLLRLAESIPYQQGSVSVETLEVPSPSNLDAAESMEASKPSLQELHRQRANELARLRALRLQQQIRSGYSPLRPRWNAIPMMSTRYSRPVVYVPLYVR